MPNIGFSCKIGCYRNKEKEKKYIIKSIHLNVHESCCMKTALYLITHNYQLFMAVGVNDKLTTIRL